MKTNSFLLFLTVAICINLLRWSSRSLTTIHAPRAVIHGLQTAQSPPPHAPLLRPEFHAPPPPQSLFFSQLRRSNRTADAPRAIIHGLQTAQSPPPHAPLLRPEFHAPPPPFFAPLRCSNRTAPALRRSIRSADILTHAPVNLMPLLHRQSGRSFYIFTRGSVDDSHQPSTSGSAPENADESQSEGNGKGTDVETKETVVDGEKSMAGVVAKNENHGEGEGKNDNETVGEDLGGERAGEGVPDGEKSTEGVVAKNGEASESDKVGKNDNETAGDDLGGERAGEGVPDGEKSMEGDVAKNGEASVSDGVGDDLGGERAGEGVPDVGENINSNIAEVMTDFLRSSGDFLVAISSWITLDMLVAFLQAFGEFGGVMYAGSLILKGYKILKEKSREGLYVVREQRENSLYYTFFDLQDVDEKRLTTKIENGSILLVYAVTSKQQKIRHEIILPPGDYSQATSIGTLDTDLGILFVEIENIKTWKPIDIKVKKKK